ncbi:MAG: Histidinol-phosphate aminotransferase [Candidatus Daviesbacteria bacterium GW2011_GWB1_39_5]|uniref:Histidinol-phosphate aminotransferase n=1 Tax=Candidatus Daviesbacteria bacterium GW2011_GWC2_40_12 TaxID=1618431 RepID=A0A0G0TU72_9BACT|nr:MAG: Histidinol-phosphate aminotransferase [Candidatus Daviesbacteria bacterium GW2011_GWF2_38_7]KKR15710.1 MAG: Histidinol-phosphate aminotransferase [Candidatus Daviesbacteria bacterium GW2011_GWA2_39_33]KKR24368.1 MAG: Histidinol-phosphate aminotransferase [Candidatus Daviesbacteria bacterium GW2011_GWB1_39_5]KKR41447.1 MAG: Histidinol-phosphate aminotransferase [Candidatus Daviesbacteria bacterium GW2011_GWC2_40_12]OGE22211.1 MAG: hypothetical protein A2778_03645 [Candidatus Daviesbacter
MAGFFSGKNMKLPKLYALNKKLKIDLSLSENPLGCSPSVFRVLRKNINLITEYPDPYATKLISSFSKRFKVSEKQILLGNGSESLIDLVCRVLLNPEDEVVLPELTFPLFEKAILLNKGKPVFIKMKEDFQIDLQALKNRASKNTKLIIVCNPNNPTGKSLKPVMLLDFIKSVKPIPVLVDEANIEFGGKSIIRTVKRNINLLVLRTFSKAYGLAGLRIGFLAGPNNLITRLKQFSQPFPLNSFVEQAAITALEDQDFLEKTKNFMTEEREFLTSELRKRNFTVFESEANNLLVKVNSIFSSATRFVQFLNKNEVSVVNGKSFRGLGDSFIRISPRRRKTNRLFLKTIDKILSNMDNGGTYD